MENKFSIMGNLDYETLDKIGKKLGTIKYEIQRINIDFCLRIRKEMQKD